MSVGWIAVATGAAAGAVALALAVAGAIRSHCAAHHDRCGR